MKLENIIHRIFDPARLDIEVKDRFGHPMIPREWFLVPFVRRIPVEFAQLARNLLLSNSESGALKAIS